MRFLLGRPHYQSELDRLFAEMKNANPGLAEGQRQGMTLLWDKKPLDLEQRRRDNRTRLKQPAYPYR